MLNIFINTWGNYNENGADGGEWITLPMDADELGETMERVAAAMNDNDPEWFVNDYEWTTEWNGRDISENESIYELNEYAEKLDGLDKWEQETYCAAVEYWGAEYVDVDDLDEYVLYSDINDEYDLGYYFATECYCIEFEKDTVLTRYFDFSAFGRDISMEADGGFTTFGWIERR